MPRYHETHRFQRDVHHLLEAIESTRYPLTKREFIATCIMQACVTNHFVNIEKRVGFAVQWTDELIAALDKDPA